MIGSTIKQVNKIVNTIASARMIKVGEQVPFDVKLWKTVPVLEDGSCPIPKDVLSKDLFENKKVVLFGLPGAFTPTCSEKHLPVFVELEKEFKSKGVDSIICIATNDKFVMSHWAKDQKVGDKVEMISDGNGEFVSKIGLNFDGTKFGMGTLRSKRFGMILENGIVKHIGVEEPGQFQESKAETLLSKL